MTIELNNMLPQDIAAALNKNDVASIRAILIADLNDSYLNIDSILQTVHYLESQPIALFEDYAISPFSKAIDENTAAWNQDYFATQLVYFNKNFSRERFLHLANVHRVLFNQAKPVQATYSPVVETPKAPVEKVQPSPNQATLNVDKVLNGYNAPQELINAIQKGDIEGIRAMIIADLNDSHLDAQQVFTMGMFVESQNKAIFVPYEESQFAKGIDENTAVWNQDYFATQLVYFNKNFSRERFLHLVNVNKALFGKAESKQPEKQPHFEAQPAFETANTQPSYESETPKAAPKVETSAYQRREESSSSYQENARRNDQESEPRQSYQEPNRSTSSSYRDEEPRHRDNDMWKTALKIGGIVAAVVIGLIAIFK